MGKLSGKNTGSHKPRREFLKNIAGASLLAALPGATSWNKDISDSELISQVEGKLPEGKLGNLSITRMIMGCNQISGYAHARDLLYANSLFKAYNTEEKVLETLRIAEHGGINTAFMTNPNYPVFNRYKEQYNGKMQSICQTYLRANDFFGDIDRAIGNGANALYIQGGEADRLVRDGKISRLAEAIEYIKKKGYLAGVGAHALEVIKSSEREQIPADFYVKTFHHDRYWSAHPASERVEFSVDAVRSDDHNKIHDNMFDLFPEKTADYMKTIRKPWIAFKVLAGGAIQPEDGFRYAFENGADFICVGMFDFQLIKNINTAIKVLEKPVPRQREWFS